MTRLYLFLVFSFVFTSLSAQPLNAEQKGAFDQFVNELIKEGSPGLAVGVVRGGAIVYERYAGLADLDSERVIDQQTSFNIASNGKQFTAWAVLNLIDQGKLNLEDDFRTIMPEILPDFTGQISIQNLLNHSSGIRDVYDLWSMQGLVWWKTAGLTNARALKLLSSQTSVQFEPGSQFSYSNSNYLILAEIVSRVTEQSFADYVQKLVQSSGLASSFFLDDHKQEIPTVAKPYFNFGDWYYYKWQSSLHGDGAFFTTLPDQLRWEQQIQNAKSTLLATAQKPLAIAEEVRYGFGLDFGEYNGVPYRYHEGATGAWKASFLRFPSLALSIVVMTNSGAVYPPGLSRQMADVLLEEQGIIAEAIQVTPETISDDLSLDEIQGTYALENGFYFRIRLDEDQILLERSNRDAIVIEQEQGNLFHQVDDPDFKQYFEKSADGGLTLTAYYPTHNPYTLTKTIQVPLDFDHNGLVGKYYNADLDVDLRINYAENNQYKLVFEGEKRYKREAQLISPQRMKASGYHLRFDTEGEKAVIRLSTDRAQDVLFTKL